METNNTLNQLNIKKVDMEAKIKDTKLTLSQIENDISLVKNVRDNAKSDVLKNECANNSIFSLLDTEKEKLSIELKKFNTELDEINELITSLDKKARLEACQKQVDLELEKQIQKLKEEAERKKQECKTKANIQIDNEKLAKYVSVEDKKVDNKVDNKTDKKVDNKKIEDKEPINKKVDNKVDNKKVEDNKKVDVKPDTETYTKVEEKIANKVEEKINAELKKDDTFNAILNNTSVKKRTTVKKSVDKKPINKKVEDKQQPKKKFDIQAMAKTIGQTLREKEKREKEALKQFNENDLVDMTPKNKNETPPINFRDQEFEFDFNKIDSIFHSMVFLKPKANPTLDSKGLVDYLITFPYELVEHLHTTLFNKVNYSSVDFLEFFTKTISPWKKLLIDNSQLKSTFIEDITKNITEHISLQIKGETLPNKEDIYNHNRSVMTVLVDICLSRKTQMKLSEFNLRKLNIELKKKVPTYTKLFLP